jgi:simple sugar transport system permease protein
MTRVPRFVFSIEFSVGVFVLLAMVVIGAINPSFWHLQNIFSLLRSNVVIGTMALGVLTVLICGGIDVSFTAFAALGAYAALRLGYAYVPNSALAPLVIGAAVGGALGCVNALLIHKIKIIPLIVTLGTGSIIRGLLLGAIGAKDRECRQDALGSDGCWWRSIVHGYRRRRIESWIASSFSGLRRDCGSDAPISN